MSTSKVALGLNPASNMDSGTYPQDPERFHILSTGVPAPKSIVIIGMKPAPVQLRPALDNPSITLPKFSHVHSAAALILCIESGLALPQWP
jgi:hypothetical protein